MKSTSTRTRSRTVSAVPHILLAATVFLLALFAAATLTVKTWRLVGDPGPQGAPDLYRLHGVTRLWSDGAPIYEMPELRGLTTYPPGSWPLLWLAYGWTTVGVARFVWWILNLAAMTALAVFAARALDEVGRLARTAAVLMTFGMPAMADAFGVGQNTIVVLSLALGATLVARRDRPTWRSDAAAAAMFDAALLKPSIAAPFYVPLLIVPGRVRPALLSVAGYCMLTLVGARFRVTELPRQIRSWLDQSHEMALQGYGNVQAWLLWLGWDDALMAASVLTLAGLAAFTWRYRHADVWLLLGLSAIVSRLWVYHQVYDDAILIVPLIAIARLAASSRTDARFLPFARATLIVSALVLWMPIHFHYAGSTIGPFVVRPSWVLFFNHAHTTVTVLMLMVLAAAAVWTARPSNAPQTAVPE